MKIINCIILVLTILAVGVPNLAISEDSYFISQNQIKGIKITDAILKLETGGKCKQKGASGELGCFQFMPSTWKSYIKIYKGTTTLPMTFENEYEVMTIHNTKMLEKYTPYQVALIHNQGHVGKCRSGINKYGVKYDSCAYANKVVKLMQ